ncbi:MAG: hypothetical protein ACE5KZ_14810 [Candidatus Scalinduaceae bacterium]
MNLYEKKHNVVDPKSRVEAMLPDMRWSTDLTKFYVSEEGWGKGDFTG